jgi:hypothetical protein
MVMPSYAKMTSATMINMLLRSGIPNRDRKQPITKPIINPVMNQQGHPGFLQELHEWLNRKRLLGEKAKNLKPINTPPPIMA